MNSVRRPVLRYHGGKWLQAKWIIGHFPKHRIYVEPFGGAASILMQKPRSYAEVYNDKWSTVVNVFRVLRDRGKAEELARLLRLTPYARDEFENTDFDDTFDNLDEIEKARRTIFRSFAGFGSAAVNGKYSTGFRANANRSGTTPAQDWMNYPDVVQFFIERLRGVVIENKDAIDVMRQHDTADTLHYVDPPYLHATRNMRRGNAAYECELTDAEHERLAKALHSMKGKVILSGYPSPMYDDYLYRDWRRLERPALADGARKRTEVLWMNFKNDGLF